MKPIQSSPSPPYSAMEDCTCEQSDEYRLLDRANQIIDRELDHPATAQAPAAAPADAALPLVPFQLPENPAPRTRDELVAEAMQMLRDNHECDHRRWWWVRGPHQCEECYHFLHEYILCTGV
jgi:hypothetical protein